MTREIVDSDDEGRPTVVAYLESPQERRKRLAAAREQAERGRQVAEAFRRAGIGVPVAAVTSSRARRRQRGAAVSG
jgi:hypothetical protein